MAKRIDPFALTKEIIRENTKTTHETDNATLLHLMTVARVHPNIYSWRNDWPEKTREKVANWCAFYNIGQEAGVMPDEIGPCGNVHHRCKR